MNSAPEKARKFFTIEQANQTLPLIRLIVGDVMQLYSSVHDRKERIARIRQIPGRRSRADNPYDEELRESEAELEKDVAKLQGFIEELESLGVELKDPATGLVDFPSLVDGQAAFLTWKPGDGEIAYWHGTEGALGTLRTLSPQATPDDPPPPDHESANSQ